MSTETTNKKIKIDNGTTFGRTYTDKAIDAKLPTDLIASANKLSLGVGSTALGNGVNLDGFTYDEATKTLKASGGGGGIPVVEGILTTTSTEGSYDITIPEAQYTNFILHFNFNGANVYALISSVMALGDMPIYKSITDIGFDEQSGAITNYATIDGSGTNLTYTSSDVSDPFISSKTIYLFSKHSILVPKDSADASILPLPSDASTSTYVLKAVNGTVQWVKEA